MKSTFIDLIYPHMCTVCGEIISGGCLCAECERKILSEVSDGVSENGVLYVIPYRSDEVKKLVFAMKRTRNRELFAFAAHLCAESLRSRLPNADKYTLTYLPRRLSNRLSEGVDQSEMLARTAAHELGLPFAKLLSRKPFTLEQKNLGAAERAENVSGIFTAKVGSVPKNVIIIDDVTTTGSSLLSAAKALHSCGAESVVLFAFAGR